MGGNTSTNRKANSYRDVQGDCIDFVLNSKSNHNNRSQNNNKTNIRRLPLTQNDYHQNLGRSFSNVDWGNSSTKSLSDISTTLNHTSQTVNLQKTLLLNSNTSMSPVITHTMCNSTINSPRFFRQCEKNTEVFYNEDKALNQYAINKA